VRHSRTGRVRHSRTGRVRHSRTGRVTRGLDACVTRGLDASLTDWTHYPRTGRITHGLDASLTDWTHHSRTGRITHGLDALLTDWTHCAIPAQTPSWPSAIRSKTLPSAFGFDVTRAPASSTGTTKQQVGLQQALTFTTRKLLA